LYHYGFRGKIFNLISSYLDGRKIETKLNGKISSPRTIDHGVPQGSVLGPLLFIPCINDLPNVSKFETTLFADDTNLHLSHNNINIPYSQVHQEISKSNNWMTNNKLSINYRKSNYVIVSNKTTNTSNFSVCINHNPIEKTDSVNYYSLFHSVI